MHNFTLFVVDDTQSARVLLEKVFAPVYRVESFASAEDCLAHLAEAPDGPDILLLDVDLPGMDGYDLCRAIKTRPGMEDVPVIFVSGLDDLDSRLDGYDAGGIDYVVKPYSLVELKHKVTAALRTRSGCKALYEQARESARQTSEVFSSLEENAMLIGFLHTLKIYATPRALVGGLFELLHAYRLEAVIQIRLPDLGLTFSANGEDHPLEMAVINHMREMGRNFSFRTRVAWNFEYISVLANNMPDDDMERFARLRDNLSLAVEYANAQLQARQSATDMAQTKTALAELNAELHTAIVDQESRHGVAYGRAALLEQDLLEDLNSAFASLGMSEVQEEGIESLVRRAMLDLAETYDLSTITQNALQTLATHLTGIHNSATDNHLTKASALARVDLF